MAHPPFSGGLFFFFLFQCGAGANLYIFICAYTHMRNERMAKVFLALCDPTRLQIVQKLAKSKGCVQEIGKRVGKNQPNVSQHLRVLKEAGLVETKRDGKRICYSVKGANVGKLIEIAQKMG